MDGPPSQAGVRTGQPRRGCSGKLLRQASRGRAESHRRSSRAQSCWVPGSRRRTGCDGAGGAWGACPSSLRRGSVRGPHSAQTEGWRAPPGFIRPSQCTSFSSKAHFGLPAGPSLRTRVIARRYERGSGAPQERTPLGPASRRAAGHTGATLGLMLGSHCPEPLRIAGPETRSRREGLWFAHSHTEPRQAPRPAPGPTRLVGAHPSPRAGPCSRPVFTVISGPGLVLLSLEMTEPLGQTRKGPLPRGLQTRPSSATSAFLWALAPCSVYTAPPRAGPSQTPPSPAGATCPSQHQQTLAENPTLPLPRSKDVAPGAELSRVPWLTGTRDGRQGPQRSHHPPTPASPVSCPSSRLLCTRGARAAQLPDGAGG